MIFLLAPNMQHAEEWCKNIAVPPVNPKDTRQVVIFTPSKTAHGRAKKRQEGDRAVIFNADMMMNRASREFMDVVLPVGFKEQEVEWVHG